MGEVEKHYWVGVQILRDAKPHPSSRKPRISLKIIASAKCASLNVSVMAVEGIHFLMYIFHASWQSLPLIFNLVVD